MLIKDKTFTRKTPDKMLGNNLTQQDTIEEDEKLLHNDRELNLQAEIDWANEQTRRVLAQYHRQRFAAYPRL